MTVCYSGGKDSEVLLELCRRAEVPYHVVHNLTTADAPETIYHVRKVFYRLELAGISCTIHKPFYKGQRTSMWQLIPLKGIDPTRRVRYCCHIFYGKKAEMESLPPQTAQKKAGIGKDFP